MHLLAVCAPAQNVVEGIHYLIADVWETHFLQRKAQRLAYALHS
jgi:hypothetical protein